MAISSSVEHGYVPAPALPSREDGDAVQLCEFTLAHAPEPHQVALHHPNPLCALFARTDEGAAVCERGCGIATGHGSTHVCPFGMAMRRLPEGAAIGHSRWVGRRFTSVAGLHQALDRLLAEDFSEEVVLANLPVNPIVDEQELADLSAGRDIAEVIALAPERDVRPAAPVAPAARPPHPVAAREEAGGLSPFGAVFEYLSQINNLLATSDQTAKVCERFLKAVGAVLPFAQAAILLRRRIKPAADAPAQLGDELVLTAAQPSRPAAGRAPLRGPLSSHELGPIVLAQGKPLVERGGTIEPFAASPPADATVGVPLVIGGKVLGVWLARLTDRPAHAPWAAEPARLMTLMGELLAARLQQVTHAAPLRNEAERPGIPVLTQTELLEAIRPEVARAQRTDSMLLLIKLGLHSDRRGLTLPARQIGQALRVALRPYDLLAMADDATGTGWHLVLPNLREQAVPCVASRVQTLVEDVLDANGGVEERGLKVTLGVSLLGIDATDAQQLVAHAAHASLQALGEAQPSAVQFYSSPEHAVN